jgi:hypothetical protein
MEETGKVLPVALAEDFKPEHPKISCREQFT